MYFDKEQWDVIGSDVPETSLGIIDNVVLVCPRVGSKYKVCIRVPSGMFSFVKTVLKISKEDLKKRPVKFFLEEDGTGQWYFTLATLAYHTAIDLWPYKGIPNWAVRGRCL